MHQQVKIAAFVALAGLCASASAQDSVSNNLGNLPGDALNPWSDHCAAYVVDLSPFTSSMGNTFGIAPIVKTSKSDSGVFVADQFFNNLYGSSTISPATVANVPYSSSDYHVWASAGEGVNSLWNSESPVVTPSGMSSRFAMAVSEFGTTTGGASFNGMVGAFVNFDPANANRLYVDRRQAAVNTPDEFQGDSAQIGGVSIDANGNLYYRGDDNNGSLTGSNQISGQNIFRTRLADLSCTGINQISSGTLNGTDRLITNHPDTLGVPNNIPARIAGGNGLSVGGNAFAASTEMLVADTGSFTSTPNHLDTTGGIGSDHRGAFGSTTHDFLGNGADYTFGIMSKAVSGKTRVLNVTGVDATGAVIGNHGFEFPSMFTDNDDGYMLSYTGSAQVYNYTGAGLFRGGVGHVALGVDQDGRGLMAALVNQNGFSDDWASQIIVCRYDASTQTEEWALAAYVDEPTALDLGASNDSKFIYDGMGMAVGQLTDLGDVTNAAIFGPGMSAPTIDSAGNIWFLSAVELFDRGPNGEPDFDSALIRAVYNPATFSYKLEMILETGQVFAGLNSGTNYRVDFLGTSTGSGASPSTIYSGNMAEFAWNGTDISSMDPSDPITNGGLVFGTSITYDTNGDGFYIDPSSNNYDAQNDPPADESYSVALYVGYYQPEGAPCIADLNGDGFLDFLDISAFLGAYNSQMPLADLNGDGQYDFLDISAFLASYSSGCP